MNIKRIIALLLTAATVSLNTFAFTPYLPEDTETDSEHQEESEGIEENQEAESDSDNAASGTENEAETESEKSDASKPGSGVQKYPQRTNAYVLFEQIMEAYVENHLYNFTKEDLMEQFFADFLTDNPEYFKFFTQYLLSTMDPYSGYYEKESKFLEGVGAGSAGFGVTVEQRDDGVYIRSVVSGSNAEKAGLKAGDRFMSVMGINVEKLPINPILEILSDHESFAPAESTPETAETVNGETTAADGNSQGTNTAETKKKPVPCSITVLRDGERIDFSIIKGTMTPSQIDATVDDNDGKPTAYVAISSFLGEGTDKEFCDIVTKYANEGIKYLTIDLRDNGGGSLDYALAMAECFIAKDEIICYYNDKNLEEPRPVYSTTDKVEFDSITILINEHTASAAELMTSILKTKGVAKVVGTTSYGKSLGQSVYVLNNGDYITITTYEILDENKETYNGVGVIPDLIIEDVKMCYTLPALGYFNHENYVEIKEGVYSEVTKALEDRLEIMGFLHKDDCDGIFDETTKSALLVFQKASGIEADGYVTHDTVTKITKTINSYKTYTYYDDSQYDAAMIVHHSFSQGKRLVKERAKLAEKQEQLIKERDEALDKAWDELHGITEE